MSLHDRLLEDDLVADQNPAFAFYDEDVIAEWKANMPWLDDLMDFRPLPRRYKSNWRILHIDGFECRTIQFFHFAEMAYSRQESSQFCGGE